MKISPLILFPVILLSFFGDVLSSNPDSELVQDSSEDNEDKGKMSAPVRTADVEMIQDSSGDSEDKGKKFAPLRSDDSQPRSLDDDSNKYLVLPNVRVLRPVISGSQVVWREVGIAEGVERSSEMIPLFTVWRDLRDNRPDSVVVTDNRNLTGVDSGWAASGNRPQRPQNNRGYVRNMTSNGNYGRRPVFPGYSPNNQGYGRATTSSPNYDRRPRPPEPQNPQFPRGNPSSNGPGSAANTPNRRVSPDANFFSGIVNNFAFKLMDSLNLDSNFVVSPLSIFTALSMCYMGSDGGTRAQLEQALGMNDNAIHGLNLHQGLKDLISLVTPDTSEYYQCFVANGMFLGKNFTPEAQFEQNIQHYYAAELRNLDFGNPQASLSYINDWVSRITRNMIPKLIDLPPPALTRLILLNAIYFKGTWQMQFPLNLTHNGRFRSLDGSEKQVPTMNIHGETFPLYRSDDHKHSFIKLPYAGNVASMIIALPHDESDRPMPTVTDETLCYIQDALAETQMSTVSIPKFRLDYTSSLRRPLMQLGINDIFDRNVVDLRKLRKQNDVFVSAIYHKAMVDVNEEGTTASAVTSIRFVPLSFKNTTSFVADHPFAFYIIHEPTGLVLFYGKIFDPEGNVASSQGNRRENGQGRPRPYPLAGGGSAPNRNPSRVRLHGAVNYEEIE